MCVCNFFVPHPPILGVPGRFCCTVSYSKTMFFRSHEVLFWYIPHIVARLFPTAKVVIFLHTCSARAHVSLWGSLSSCTYIPLNLCKLAHEGDPLFPLTNRASKRRLSVRVRGKLMTTVVDVAKVQERMNGDKKPHTTRGFPLISCFLGRLCERSTLIVNNRVTKVEILGNCVLPESLRGIQLLSL